MNITIFDTSTGQIKSNVVCPVGLASAQLLENDDFIYGAFDSDAYYIESFNAVAMPERPSEHHIFNFISKQWEDPRTVADMKIAKNAAINAARLKTNQSHFTFAGKQIAVDPLSRSDIDATHGAVLMLGAMPPGWPGAWKSIDNEYVTIPDYATWVSFYGAMVAQGTANFQKAQALKLQLSQATTISEIDSISWE